MAVSDLGRARDPVTPYPLASPEDLAATARTVEAAGRRSLAFSADVTNVHGGAIALGHPIGASGACVLVTLVHALDQRGLCRGLATLCLGGGEAVAMVIERVG